MTHTAKPFQQQPWSLTDLFPALDSAEVTAALATLQETAARFEQMRSRLRPDIDTAAFLDMVRQYEDVDRQASRLQGFARLSFTADTQNQRAQSFQAEMRQHIAEIINRTLFFSLWWKEIDDANAARLMDASGDYAYWLDALRRQKPYTLSESEEKIINLKNVNGVRALTTLYEAITNRYTFKLTVDGQEKELTRGELQAYYRDPDPDVRAACYRSLHHVYTQDAPILGQIYQSVVRDWRSEHLNLRGFAAPISVRNLMNDVPDAVVDTLLQVCQANAPLFHRYFRLKAQWLGVEKLRRYDIYAPFARTTKRYDFGDAADLVLRSFREFDPHIADLARRVFVENHLDSEVRKGKRSGAFCATIEPALTPWVSLSYQGRPDDVATLAHELGHAIHSLLADHHSVLTQQSSLPLAETASTFAEMLVIDRLLAEDPNPEVERDLLFTQLDDAYATIMRQAYLALFEREAHGRIAAGASVDALSDLYLDLLREQFGDALDLSDDFRVEWVEIPHIYAVPFYVYAYAFGQLLVLSLYQQYLQEGEAFKPRYKAILAAGGSAAPVVVLENAGIDVHSADFWQGGFDVVAHTLDRLAQIPLPTR
ncbi:MAG: M3 family oligoendopeptidase [Anaerolineales bacterium]|nr:M3 family oligoendopeptidase [Anaerolineales bacterium]